MRVRTVLTAIRSDPSTVTVRIRALQEELDSLHLAASDLSLNVSGMGEEAIRFSRNSAENWIPHMIFWESQAVR